jgi:hypothetical protein
LASSSSLPRRVSVMRNVNVLNFLVSSIGNRLNPIAKKDKRFY